MDAIGFETAAFVLMAISLPLISMGSTGAGSLWIVGFAVLAIGAAIPPAIRFTSLSESAM